MPTVTVIVPVRNRSGVIVRCLDSVVAQTYAAVRLIVVDNGSTDDSRSVVADWLETHAPRFLEAACSTSHGPAPMRRAIADCAQ